MGIGGIGIWQLLIILVIVLLLFGTKRLRGLGGDLGGAIKGFKKAMTDDNASKTTDVEPPIDPNEPVEVKQVTGESVKPNKSEAVYTAKTEPLKNETK